MKGLAGTLPRAGSATAGCPGPPLVEFWVSPRQPLSATGSCVGSQSPWCPPTLPRPSLTSCWVSPQHVLLSGVVLPLVQDMALLLVEPHEVPAALSLHLVEVPLDSSMTFWCINHSSQLGVIYKPAEGTPCPITLIINEVVKQDWTQYGPLGNTTSDKPPSGPCAADHHPLGLAFEPIFSPC